MKTAGVIQSIDTAAEVRTEILDADSARPVLDVLNAVLEHPVTAAGLSASNPLPPDDPRLLTWGDWCARHPVTVLGAEALTRGRGPTPVSVIAGPDSGFTLDIDPRATTVSRLPHERSLVLADPCLSRSPTRLHLGPSGAHTHSRIGSTVILPGAAIGDSSRPRPAERRPGLGASETVHIAPAAVTEPRPARPPQWWAFLIPIGIGVALALLTGMWWFLLFSLSAPLSGYLAHFVEKRRFTRDATQYDHDRAHALEDALVRAQGHITHRRQSAGALPGLCLGFGPALSSITLAPELAEHLDHVDDRPVIDDVPLTIDPRSTSVVVTGDRAHLTAMLLAWLNDERWEWAPSDRVRDLPELVGAAPPGTPEEHREARASPAIPVDLVPADPDTPADATATLRLDAPASQATLSLVLTDLAQAHTLTSTVLDGPVPGRSFTAALMPPGRFLTLRRSRIGSGPAGPTPHHGLRDHYDDAPAAISRRWASSAIVPARIGRGPAGDVALDLFRHGPHALVAGTTGSGKSMLLQTWLIALALQSPPERLTFVLIDFKGGATFAPLRDLPHTDSVLDDFDSAAAFRALVSVRAEITRRERLLALHGVSDVGDLAAPPPRLVVVIDEFHALMTTHPKAADLLEHLTALGRSLGVHLILATQRPLGVVTGQMKANINLRICLRVRDETDSFDVLGIGDAAHLPVEHPGTALLDSGSALVRFRVAVPFANSSAEEAEDSDAELHRPRLRPWSPQRLEHARAPSTGVRVANILTAAALHPEANTASLHSLAPCPPGPRHAVVAPPLPTVEDAAARAGELLAAADTGVLGRADADTAQGALAAGAAHTAASATRPAAPVTAIVDIPAAQRQFAWTYDPTVDGSALIVGGTDAEVSATLVQMAAAAASTHRIVTLGRIAEAVEHAAIRCGMDAGWRLHAVLDHLSHASIEQGASSAPTLVVCGNWNELGDSLDHHTAAALDQLLTHARGLGLTFLLAGCRTALTTSATFRTQLIFPPHTGRDGLSVGLSRQRFIGSWPRMRAVLLGPHTTAAGSDGADCQLLVREAPAPHHRSDVPVYSPRWCGLAADVSVSDLDWTPPAGAATGEGPALPLGLDPFAAPVVWRPEREGSVLTVRGASRSGKTELTQMLGRLSSDVRLHDDAHLLTDADLLPVLDGGIHVVTMPLRYSPGYGSPLAKAPTLGPMLVLGRHSSQDLATLGLLRVPPLDGAAGTGWFATEAGARAIKLFRAEPTSPEPTGPGQQLTTGGAASSAAPPESSQSESAGGPVRVS